MPQTLSEKIFSKAANKKVKAGDFVLADIDCAMTHDITGPLAVEGFREIVKGKKKQKVWNPEKIIILFDHQVPADSLNAASNQILMRNFAKEQGILNYDVFEGVCHQVMPEKGHVKPGDLIVGSDSHTCTYGALGAFSTGIGSTDMAFVFATGKLWFKVPHTMRFEVEGELPRCVYPKDVILHIIGDVGAEGARYMTCEFSGETVKSMDIAGRMTMCNMAIEMGGKAGIVEADSTTEKYLRGRVPDFKDSKFENSVKCSKSKSFTEFSKWKSDEDAAFAETKTYDVSMLSPQVACPHNVDNVKSVEEVEGIKLDQVFIGSCTNGRFEDLEVVAKMMNGEKVAKELRLLIIPASRTEYLKALKAGYIEQFIEAGAIVEMPCCGPCMGGSFGLLGKGEVGLSTSNRNFKGRQGSPDALVYLSSPATAAASALYGEITDPRKV